MLTANSELADYLVAEIAVIDAAGAIVRSNRKWQQTAIAGQLALKPTHWNYMAECEAAIRRGCAEAAEALSGLRAILNGGVRSFTTTYPCPFGGRHHWYEVLISPFDFDGERHAVVMHVDVSALQRDPLTGLANRAMFDAQLGLVLSAARRGCGRTGVAIVDLDGLKRINDTYGHRVGSEALKTIAAELETMKEPDSLPARIGGDEFGIVLPVYPVTASAIEIRARFETRISCSIREGGNIIPVSASVGLALYPDDGTTARALLASADASMYAAKRGSRSLKARSG
jgi:diguanylate cyclase (GGDEF)-like protein